MLGSANAQLGSAILGFGAAQGMLLGSSWNPSALVQHEKRSPSPSSSQPVAISRGVMPSVEASAAAVSGSAGSSPRSSSFVHTRRELAPTHCLSRTGRRKRRGPGGAGDDDISDGGNDGGPGGGAGGGGEDGDSWFGDEDPQGRAGSGLLWLWQAFCLCSFLQAVHYLATGAKTNDLAQTSALASLTNSLYNEK